jgi:gentisate 1,2-dioxygenase
VITEKSVPDATVDAELEAFYADLAAVHLHPLWTITKQLLTPTPQPRAVPWLWSAETLRPLAERALRLIPVERGGERRVLSLGNPGLGGPPPFARRDPVRAGGQRRLDDRERRRVRHVPR